MVGIKNFIKTLPESFKALKWYEWLMIAIMTAIALNSMVSAFLFPTEDGNPGWLSIINFISAICGILCIFFTAKAHISNFIFGTLNTVVYVIYLAYWHIYGTMCLEIFVYFPIGIISWITWYKNRADESAVRTKARKLNPYQNLLVAVIVTVATAIYHWLLVKVGGEVAWLDAMTVSIGIAATVLEMLRYREQYIWWLITDFVAVAMFIVHFDPVYLTKKTIYLIMAVIGLINWIKLSKQDETTNIEKTATACDCKSIYIFYDI